MQLDTVPLHPSFGLEIRSIDLRAGWNDDLARELDRLFVAHGLLLFRDQTLDDDDQSAVSRAFGTLTQYGTSDRPFANHYVGAMPPPGRSPSIPHGPMDLHFDGCFNRVPYRATTLYCVDATERGGETLLCDVALACRELPPTLRAAIDGLLALNAYITTDTRRPGLIDPRAKMAVHPIVQPHPDSGLPTLFVNRLMTMRILDIDAEQSEQLLQSLFEHMEQDRFVHAHAWRKGDLLILDNRRIAHGRKDFDPSERRLLRRQTTKPGPSSPTHQGERVASSVAHL